MKRPIIFLLAYVFATLIAYAQDQARAPSEPSGVPIITGYTGVVSTFQPGEQQVAPTVTPILLIPLGERWLIEAEGEFEGEYTHHNGEPWEREWEKNVEYLQADYLANKYVTIVAGRFLTPFGVFNERLHPLWIKNLQTTPIIFSIATGSGNGGMVRGGIGLARGVNLNYVVYFSASSTVRALEATRNAGSRVSLFFPNERLEVGTSFQRQLQNERFNSYGVDFTWQVKPIPLDFRGEYARNREQGSGYWIESAYRPRQVPFAQRFFRKSQAVLRMEQFFTPTGHEEAMEEMPEEEEGGHGGALPVVDTQRFTFGWNYYFSDAVKLSTSYGRQFSAEGDRNIWSVGIVYRWVFSMGGRQK